MLEKNNNKRGGVFREGGVSTRIFDDIKYLDRRIDDEKHHPTNKAELRRLQRQKQGHEKFLKKIRSLAVEIEEKVNDVG